MDTEFNGVLPRHVAIIMDGNGRWAQARNLPRAEGHRAGVKAVRKIVAECRRLAIPFLTLYAFSSENWNRPKAEIIALFSLLLDFLRLETPLMEEQAIKLNVLGDLAGLPLPQRTALKHAMARTANGTGMTLNLALNYGARDEIVAAVKKIVGSGLPPDRINTDVFAQFLYTAGQPDPDLVIRTSGEQRLSNYLLYQCAYSEFHFTSTLWPDFDENELAKALLEYSGRKRRFGRVDEQVTQGGTRNGC